MLTISLKQYVETYSYCKGTTFGGTNVFCNRNFCFTCVPFSIQCFVISPFVV